MIPLKRHWLLILFVIAVLSISGYFFYQSQQVADLNIPGATGETPVSPPAQPPAKAPADDTAQGGHFHEDGTFHAQPHDTPSTTQTQKDTTAAPTPPTAQTPTETTPPDDPIAAAWERLEYISQNIYEWGGVASPRATQLIDELMPPPVLIDEGHGEKITELIVELIAQRDPRSAEVLVAYKFGGGISGKAMTDALVEIGPPSVPLIIPYLIEDSQTLFTGRSIMVLGRIAEEYRSELGGIVEHIIIPRLEVIVADEDFERFDSFDVRRAQEVLARLEK